MENCIWPRRYLNLQVQWLICEATTPWRVLRSLTECRFSRRSLSTLDGRWPCVSQPNPRNSNKRICFCADSIRSLYIAYWGDQIHEQYSRIGRTKKIYVSCYRGPQISLTNVWQRLKFVSFTNYDATVISEV